MDQKSQKQIKIESKTDIDLSWVLKFNIKFSFKYTILT